MDNLLTSQFWHDQWAFVMNAPWIIFPLLLTAGFVGWRWKASNDDGEIRGCRAERDAVKAQLLLAHDKQGAFGEEINQLRVQIAKQTQTISELRTIEAARYQFDALSSNSALVSNTITNLSTANSELGATLTITGGRYRLMVEPNS